MDTWVTHVYGTSRTQRVVNATATHHTGAHGTRYNINGNNEKKLRPALARGKRQIGNFMQDHDIVGYQKYIAAADTMDKPPTAYPMNYLRNVAVKGARTDWVITLESDMALPSHARQRMRRLIAEPGNRNQVSFLHYIL
jgi:hypothetical protein